MSLIIQSNVKTVESQCEELKNAISNLGADNIMISDDIQTNAIVNTNNSSCNDSIKRTISILSENVRNFSELYNNIGVSIDEVDKIGKETFTCK